MTSSSRSRRWCVVLLAAICMTTARAHGNGAVPRGPRAFVLRNGMTVALQRGVRPAPAEVVWLVRTTDSDERSDTSSVPGIGRDVLAAPIEGQPAWRYFALSGAMPSAIVSGSVTGVRIVSLPSDVERVIRGLATAVGEALRSGGNKAGPDRGPMSRPEWEGRDPLLQAKLELERIARGEPSVDAPMDQGAEPGMTDAVHDRHQPSGMILGVLTSDDPSALAEVIRATFGTIPAGTAVLRARATVDSTSMASAAVRCLLMPEARPAVVAVGLVVQVHEPTERVAWEAFAHMLAGSHASRLHRRLRLDQPLVYTIESDTVPLGRDRLLLRVVTRSSEPDAALAVIRGEIDSLRTGRWRDEEWRAASAVLASRAALDREQQTALFVHALAARLSPEAVMSWPPVPDARLTPRRLHELLRHASDSAAHVVVASAGRVGICQD